MVDRGLSGSPLTVSIGHWRVLGKNSADVPEEQVGVVDESLGVHGIVVHANGSLLGETTADTSDDEEDNPGVSDSASHVEILDRELTDNSETEEDSQLSATAVVGPVEVGTVDGSGDLVHLSSGEPGFEDIEISDSFIGPDRLGFLDDVIGHTETDKFSILDVLGNLGVKSTSHSIIISVLLFLGRLPGGLEAFVRVVKRNS